MDGRSGATNLGEHRFKLLMDTLPYPAFALFADGQAEYYNQAFLDYVGAAIGSDKAARMAIHHPDDHATLEAAREAVRLGEREWVIEARIRRHDGAYRWHRVHNRPLLADGRASGFVGTAVDIHDVKLANEALERRVEERTAALRSSEQRYRMLYNRTPMALQSIDARARLLDVNDTWTDLFGWSREEALGRSPSEYMTADSAARYHGWAWPSLLRSSGETHTVEYEFITKSGRVFDGRLSACGEFDGDGQFIRSWSAIADISAEKQAARELLQAQRMEAVGQLTAGIAHDFNNLLTAILGNLELLARRLTGEPLHARLLERAREAAVRGARLTAQLLAFSRQQPISTAPVDVNRLCREITPLLQSTIGATVFIALELQPELGPAHADATQLELAVLNLALNARDAMATGGVLTISTGRVTRGAPIQPEEPEAGDYIVLTVADTGLGIASDVRGRIFEPFFTTKDIGKGSGLGLSQALGLLKQLRGGIAVRSAPGGGARFDLLLRPADADAVAQEPPKGIAAARPPQRRLTLMLVDDDAAVRSTAAEMLREAGHTVWEHATGEAALAQLTRARPDLLLSDVAMPGLGGVALAAAAHARHPGLPVLFMTGYAAEKLLDPAMAETVIRKPFATADLLARIETATRSAAELSENLASAP